jgi:hypothetical protein
MITVSSATTPQHLSAEKSSWAAMWVYVEDADREAIAASHISGLPIDQMMIHMKGMTWMAFEVVVEEINDADNYSALVRFKDTKRYV